MKAETRNLAITFGVIFTLVLIVFLSLKSRDNKIEKLQNQVFELKQGQDTLFKSNENFIEEQRKLEVKWDSIYKLTKKSNEVYIVHHWDSVYYAIINSPDQSEIANFLRNLGQK
jgi:hypothetical protein